MTDRWQLTLLLMALTLACTARHDGGASPPPDLRGAIVRIGDGTISLDSDRPPVVIAVRGSTRITTARGESIGAGDLVVGMHAKVWLDRMAAGPVRVAAAIVIGDD